MNLEKALPSNLIISQSTLVLIIFLLYTLSFSLVIPAYPKLLLNLNHDNSATASLTYGMVSSLRYLLEFFSNQYLGLLSDRIGRKPILITCFLGVFFEFLLIALYPSVSAIILSKLISGALDVTTVVCHSILVDISSLKNVSVTKYFGMLGAVLSFGFVFGPIIGSIIASYSIRLCFIVSSLISLVALCLAITQFEETVVVEVPTTTLSPLNWDPFHSLRNFFAISDLRLLSIPYLLGNSSHGVYFIWVLYMHYRFHCSIIQAGLFLSLSGLCGAIIQGLVTPLLVPTIYSEYTISIVCLLGTTVQYFLYGYFDTLEYFYIIMVCFSFNYMYGPAIQGLIVDKSGYHNQGSIQGALGSLRMITSFFGSLFFPSMFAISINFEIPFPGLSFYIASIMSFIGFTSLRYFLRYCATSDSVDRIASDEQVLLPTETLPLLEDKSLLFEINRKSSPSTKHQYLGKL